MREGETAPLRFPQDGGEEKGKGKGLSTLKIKKNHENFGNPGHIPPVSFSCLEEGEG